MRPPYFYPAIDELISDLESVKYLNDSFYEICMYYYKSRRGVFITTVN